MGLSSYPVPVLERCELRGLEVEVRGRVGEEREAAMTAKTLSEYRAERYLTVDEFAELIGVTPQTLYRIARGETRPRPTTIRRIAKSLGVHPTEIAEFAPNRTGSTSQSGV
jgi:DNA-binding XRE family transcriptional regulator